MCALLKCIWLFLPANTFVHLETCQFSKTLAEFPNTVPVIVNRSSNTKLRPQVKQARLPTKMEVTMGLYI